MKGDGRVNVVENWRVGWQVCRQLSEDRGMSVDLYCPRRGKRSEAGTTKPRGSGESLEGDRRRRGSEAMYA